ncbi:DUF4920 domain-containing protein [Flavobacterium sp. RHBU_3]|uniref:DUF4920 domain-containing protein n=1 Tax=Flavobacterium sp. RHBU_3 TaxID=3391184 RepID=UPI003984EDA1
MRKTLVLVAALMSMAACKKNETEVKTENTVIEGEHDTLNVDTDTVTNDAEAPEAKESSEAVEAKESPEKPEAAEKKVSAAKIDYASFGDKILADNAMSKEQMLKKYSTLKPGDSVTVKFKTNIKEVCQKKGCWMSLDLSQGKESFVKFKDYAFFVPLNAGGQEAIVHGKAFVSETSVAQLKHYAKDGGKSDEEIAKITKPEVKYGFMADGVLISK